MENNLYIAFNKDREFIGLKEFGSAAWLNYIEVFFDKEGKFESTKRFGNGHYHNLSVDESFEQRENELFEDKHELEMSLGKLVVLMRKIQELKDVEISITKEIQNEYSTIIYFQIKGFEQCIFSLFYMNEIETEPSINTITLNDETPRYYRDWHLAKDDYKVLFENEQIILKEVMNASVYKEYFRSHNKL